MHVLTVALVTNRGGVNKGENWPDLVLDSCVAVGTFDLTIRDMFLMHEGGGMPRVEYLGFMMALETLPFRDMTVSLNDMNMALLAGDPPGDILPVIEIPALDADVAFRLNVTRSAPPHGTRDAFLFSCRPCTIKMADETVGFVDS
jgi:hypothetical protein